MVCFTYAERFEKLNFPGLYEASAGGSSLVGEGPNDTSIREFKEETRIEVSKLE